MWFSSSILCLNSKITFELSCSLQWLRKIPIFVNRLIPISLFLVFHNLSEILKKFVTKYLMHSNMIIAPSLLCSWIHLIPINVTMVSILKLSKKRLKRYSLSYKATNYDYHNQTKRTKAIKATSASVFEQSPHGYETPLDSKWRNFEHLHVLCTFYIYQNT